MSLHVTTLQRQRILRKICLLTVDRQRIDLDERLIDLHHSHVHQLYSTIVGSLRTFDGQLITHFDTPGSDRIVLSIPTVLVKCAVDIKLASAIVHVPVTISGIGDTRHSTSDTISLGVRTCNHLCTSSSRHLGNTLDDVHLLSLVTTVDLHRSRAAFSCLSREGQG